MKMPDIQNRYFSENELEEVAHILADTENGLTGSQIAHFLQQCSLDDISPDITKWKRLTNAFIAAHNKYRRDNFLLTFISKALDPVRFTQSGAYFRDMIDKINGILVFKGLEYREDGKFYAVKRAENLSEAEERTGKLRKVIQDRHFHPKLLDYCKAELLSKDYFHAVMEAVKGIAAVVRQKTGLQLDGWELFRRAFDQHDGIKPLLVINNYTTNSEQSEQKGFLSIINGLYGIFRNPLAHNTKDEWPISEQDALDLFAMASYIYRRLDDTKPYQSST
jgi:uncharacterized protein (TIGR02391 family)